MKKQPVVLSKNETELALPNSASELLSNLVDVYPAEDKVSLKKVLSLGKVEYCDEQLIPGMPMTACVINTKPYTLMFGKKFLEEQVKSVEGAVYVLSHELTHLVLDHFAPEILNEFEDKKLGKAAAHIIVDCQVNATVHNSLSDDKYFEFIKRYYDKNQVPYCFFRSDGEPDGENLSKEMKRDLKSLHDKLYSPEGITNKELIDGLMPWFQQEQDKLNEMVENLLGNHKDLFKDKGSNGSGEEIEELTKVVAENLLNTEKESEIKKKLEEKFKEDGRGRKPGKGNRLVEQRAAIVLENLEAVRKVRQQFKKAQVISPSAKIFKAINEYNPKTPVRTVIPNFYDRTTAAWYYLGKFPIFHKSNILGSKVIVPCYLDVSGSQNHVIPEMLKVVPRLKKLLGNVIYCFSNHIHEAKISELQKGKYHTTGGTDFNPVFNHILKNNFRQAVIFTDGEAYADERLIQKIKLRNINITVGWTVSNPQLNPLSKIAAKTLFVFDKDK